MTWLQRYRIRSFFLEAVWIFPVLAIVASFVAVRICYLIDLRLKWEPSFLPDAARGFVAGLASSMFTLIIFVASALLVAVQLASAQLTPRIIALVFRDPLTKFSLSVFTFTYGFCMATKLRINDSVPLLTLRVAAYSCTFSIALFVFLIDHVGRFVRPSGALRSVALQGRRVLRSVYPSHVADPRRGPPPSTVVPESQPTRVIVSRRGGTVLAVDTPGLVALAEKVNCVIEMVPLVGDFLAVGDPLFRLYDGGAGIPERAFHHSVAVGQERTMEQDPTFSFRIMVDVASKGLSPAINDPTTAVLAIDQIHHLLRDVGSRRLDEGPVRDPSGKVRFVCRTPDWENFVQLAVTEIRHFGETSVQVARRLRAMLDNLIETLPNDRAAPLRNELKLLNRSTERAFAEPADRALADVSDTQGVGGKCHPNQPRSSVQPLPIVTTADGLEVEHPQI